MKKLVIIIAVAALVLGGTIAAVIGVYNSPKQVAARALRGVAEDLPEREEIAPLKKILSGGSIEFRADSEELNELLLLEEDIAFAGKLYFGENTVYLNRFTALYGNKILNGDLYISEDMAYVKNPEILEGTWGLEKGNLANEWKRSVFAPDSGSEFALEAPLFDAIKEILEALDNEVDKEMATDLEKLVDRYVEKAWKLVAKHAEFESEKGDVRINKERREARTITITLDKKAVSAVVSGLYDYLVEDDDLANLAAEYGERFSALLKEMYGIEDATDSYDKLLVDLEDKLDAALERIEEYMDGELVATVVTPPSGDELLMLKLEYEDTDYLTVQIGHAGLSKTDCISVKITDGTEFVYRMTEDSKEACKAEFQINGETVGSFEHDRKKSTYSLDVLDVWSIEGGWKTKGGKHTITVERMERTIFGLVSEYDDLGITLTVSEKDKMPEHEKTVDSLLTANEKTIRDWLDRLAAYEIFDFNDAP